MGSLSWAIQRRYIALLQESRIVVVLLGRSTVAAPLYSSPARIYDAINTMIEAFDSLC